MKQTKFPAGWDQERVREIKVAIDDGSRVRPVRGPHARIETARVQVALPPSNSRLQHQEATVGSTIIMSHPVSLTEEACRKRTQLCWSWSSRSRVLYLRKTRS